MSGTKYTLKKANTGLLGDHIRESAQVDDITLHPGGEPVELTDDQVKRLKDAGVTLEAAAEKQPTSSINNPQGS